MHLCLAGGNGGTSFDFSKPKGPIIDAHASYAFGGDWSFRDWRLRNSSASEERMSPRTHTHGAGIGAWARRYMAKSVMQ